MRNPFEKERKTDIGLDMTPRRIVVRGGSGKLSDPHLLDEMLKSGRKPRQTFESKPSPQKIPASPRPPRIPRTKPEKADAPVSRRMKMPVGSSRRCIVKVDMRGYSPSERGKEGNRRLLDHRLDPFKSSSSVGTGSKMAYIGRDEAIDGELFSYENGKLTAVSDCIEIIADPNDPPEIYFEENTDEMIKNLKTTVNAYDSDGVAKVKAVLDVSILE